MTEIEIVGPKVTVDRDGTSDSGGGQLMLRGGKLMVRAATLEREIGALAAIADISIVDLARARARIRFIDGVVWNVASEAGESIYDFLKQIEETAGRPGLVPPPPSLSMAVRQAATPQRRRWMMLSLVALAMFFPVRMLAAVSAPVGHVMALVSLLLLGVVVTAIGLRDGGPDVLERVRNALAKLGPVPVVALLLAVAAGSALGANDAEARADEAAERAQRVQRAQERAQAEADQVASAAAAKRKAVASVVAELDAALGAQRYRDAKDARERLRTLDPQHPALAKGGAELAGALAKVDEAERVSGLQRAIRSARRMAKDRLRCEDAKRVSDAWRQLSAVRPSDTEFEQARRAVPTLERCRRRVAERFAISAEGGLRQTRAQTAPGIEAQLRQLGYPTTVTLEGKQADQLVLAAGELDAAAVARITALTDGDGTAFLDKRASEGVRAVIFRGDKFDKRFDLKPVSTRALTRPLLERFGLADPLDIPAAPESAPSVEPQAAADADPG